MNADFKRISDSVYFFPGVQFDCYSYLIFDETTFLVDPGTGRFFPELSKALEDSGAVLEAIVNTHCHYDHAGADHFFDCPVYAREPDLTAIREGNEYTLASMFSSKFEPVDAEPLPEVFSGWQVIPAPGHTPGSIAMYKEIDGKKMLLSGDTLFPDGVGRTDLPGGNPEELASSLKLLNSLEFDFLLSGHGCSGEFL